MRGFLSSAAYSYSLVFHSVLNGILLVPYLIAQVGSEAYAQWLIMSSVALMMQMFDPGFGQVTTERLRKARNFEQRRDTIISAAVLSVCIIVLVQLIGISILTIFPYFPGEQKLNQVVLLATSLILLENMLYGIFLGLSRELTAAITSITSIFANLAVVIIGIEAGLGLAALALGLCVKPLVCIAIAIAILVAEFWMNRIQKLPIIRWEKVFLLRKELLLSARGKVLISGANGSDVVILGAIFDPLIVVAYAMTKRASDFLKMFIQKPTLALHPTLSEYKKSDLVNSEYILKYSSISLYTVSFAASTYFLLNEMFLDVWLPERHYAGDLICLIFAITFALSIVQGYGYVINSAFGRYEAVSKSQSLFSFLLVFFLLAASVLENIVVFSLMPALAIVMAMKYGDLIEVRWFGGIKTFIKLVLILFCSIFVSFLAGYFQSDIIQMASGFVFGSLFVFFFIRQHACAADFERRGI